MTIWLERLTFVLGALLALFGIWALYSWSMPLSDPQRLLVAPVIVVAVAALTLFVAEAIAASTWQLRLEMAAKGLAAGGCLWWGGFAVLFALAIGAGFDDTYAYVTSGANAIAVVGAIAAIVATFLSPASRRLWTRVGGAALVVGGILAAIGGVFPNSAPAVATMSAQEYFALQLVLMAAPAIVLGTLLVAVTMMRPSNERERPVAALLRSLAGAPA